MKSEFIVPSKAQVGKIFYQEGRAWWTVIRQADSGDSAYVWLRLDKWATCGAKGGTDMVYVGDMSNLGSILQKNIKDLP